MIWSNIRYVVLSENSKQQLQYNGDRSLKSDWAVWRLERLGIVLHAMKHLRCLCTYTSKASQLNTWAVLRILLEAAIDNFESFLLGRLADCRIRDISQ